MAKLSSKTEQKKLPAALGRRAPAESRRTALSPPHPGRGQPSSAPGGFGPDWTASL